MPAPGPDKELCGAKTPTGKYPTCHQTAGANTDHLGIGRCWRHGGRTESHQKSASLEIARQECVTLGIPVETTPADALMEEVWEACGNVAFYRGLVQALPTHPAPDLYIDPADIAEEGLVDPPPEADEKGHWERGEIGIYGPTYHVSGIPTGEAKEHILVRLYNEERKRKLDAAAAALRAGVDERRLRIAEADAERIMSSQMAAFKAMGLADRLEEFRGHFARFLAAGDEPAHLGAASAG
jgi:hypothetical protein